jgi:NAD(P)H-dependent FMN reductase
MAKLLFLAGSASKNSLNKKLAKHASELATAKGADAHFIDLKDYEMPLYCTDWELENGIPDNAKKLKKLFVGADGFFIASPEYNSTFTPLLKNIIDWMSRPHEEGEAMLVAYKGKVAALGSVSPGALGGIRGLPDVRSMLSNIGVHVIPTQIAVGGKDVMNDDGSLVKDMHINMMDNLINEFIKTADGIHA